MKALVMTNYLRMEFMEVPKPKITQGDQVLVRIKAASICGSDVHGFDGSTGRRKPPIIMGHEASGVIVEVGEGVKHFAVNDRVTFDSTINCGHCGYCKSGQVNLCDNRRVLGVSCDEYKQDGIFAEYAVIPEHILYRLPDNVDFVQAALTEPASVAAHAISLSPPLMGENVAVIGSGLIGLLAIKELRGIVNGKIFAFDTDASRMEKAKQCGADYAFDSRDPDLARKIGELTGGRMIDRSWEAVGITPSIATAIALTRKGGTVTLIGNVSPTVTLPLQSVVTRQIRLQGSCAISGEYPTVLGMLSSGALQVKDLISKEAPLSEGQEWFTKLYNHQDNLLKVVLIP